MHQLTHATPLTTSGIFAHFAAGLISCLLLLTGALFLLPAFAKDQDILTVGIFPRRSAETTRQMFQPMMDYLQQELSMQVRIDVPPDFQAFWERLSEGAYDLVHLNQYQYLLTHKQFGYRAILMNEELGRSLIASVIWVRKDSGIRRPEDLRGKKIIFGGGRQAMVSYIMALDLLKSHGLEDSEYMVQFAMNPVNAVLSLYYRQGMAAGAGDVLPQLPVLKKAIDLNEIRPLLTSQPVAQLPWAVSPGVSGARSQRIRELLARLKETLRGRELLAVAGLSGLEPATDLDYDPHRKIVARVLGEQF